MYQNHIFQVKEKVKFVAKNKKKQTHWNFVGG
jgi:hypothetical protein